MIHDMTTGPAIERADGTIIGAWATEYCVYYRGRQFHEDYRLTNRQQKVTHRTPQDELRELFPFRLRLKKDCVLTGQPAGYVFEYACARQLPMTYPMMALYFEGTDTRWGNFNSHEAELFIPKGSGIVTLATK